MPIQPTLRVAAYLGVALSSTSLHAQTGRTMSVAEPPQAGKPARFEVAYPASAAGNFGLFVLSDRASGTTSLPIPGFTTFGMPGIAPTRLLGTVPWSPAGGGGAGTAAMTLNIPAGTALVGIPFDVQSVDFDFAAQSLYWSDGDLELTIDDAGCGTTASFPPLYPAGTPLEPDVVVDTSSARVTYLADRARDRHAREDVFQQYDHWLPFYWEQRIAELEIVDRVARGGNSITFRFMTHDGLNPAEFRCFFSGVPTVAVYHLNLSTAPGTGVSLISTTPSTRYPGETEYRYEATVARKLPENRPLRIGDRVEVELSQFLQGPRNGRPNYYGTAFLYIVGEGVVPWYAKEKEEAQTPQQQQNASFDSYRLPDVAWLGGATTLPYPYSNEPEHRFKQTAGNISPSSGHEFVLGRRLHHTDFGTGAHSEPGNPPMAAHTGQLGPKFVARSCVECHLGNGRSLPPVTSGDPLIGAVVRVGGDPTGAPHPTFGETLQPYSTASQATLRASIEAESYGAASGVALEPTLDVGGGLNVTSIDSGDWMSFANRPVTLPTTGPYRVEFRVASTSGGGLLAFEESGGAVIHGRVPVPSTGGPQTWQTISADLTLSAGTHRFGLNANVGGFNLNWFRVSDVSSGGGGTPGEGDARLDRWEFVAGAYGDGQPFRLRRPHYRFDAPNAPRFFSVRNAPPLVGLGLLEAVDEATILTRHDPCDADQDGISGRAAAALEFATGQSKLGRFGWKGTRASVRDQIAFALNRDMGVASATLPILDGDPSPSAPEVTAVEVDRITRYVALLGVSARRDLIDAQALRGEQLFVSAGCARCHVPELTTGSGHPYGELRGQTIRPFTDLLLHDMGPGLADGMADGDATATEWRTAPLWNLGWTAAVAGQEAYLHDGRARSLAEAVLWHGGEAETAKEAFRTMPATDRAALIAFLESL